MQKVLKVSVLIMAAMLVVFISSGAHGPEKVEWGYEAENGPDVWGQLSPDYALCSNGVNQSPINIAGAIPINLPDIIFNSTSSKQGSGKAE